MIGSRCFTFEVYPSNRFHIKILDGSRGSVNVPGANHKYFVIPYFPVRLFDFDPIRACSVVNEVEKLEPQAK